MRREQAASPLETDPPASTHRAGAVLVLGEPGGLGVALVTRLERDEIEVLHRPGGTDEEAAAAVTSQTWQALVVASRNDVEALRLALLCAHLRPDIPLVVTLFDRTVGRELQVLVPWARVVSPAQHVATTVVRQCLAAGVRPAPRWRAGVRIVDDALRLMLLSATALLFTIAVEACAAMIALDEPPLDAVYVAVRSATTVAPPPEVLAAPAWFKVVSILSMLVSLGVLAVVTAALVRRLGRVRLTTVLGARAAPLRCHVLLIGFGQVGFRVAQELRRAGIPVLGVDRDPDAPSLRLARAAGIPVAIARGDDREVLERLGVRRCAAVTVVTSDDLVNVSVGLAVADAAPGVPVVLRLGDGEVAAETDSLLHLGHICDPHSIAADALLAELTATWDSAACDACVRGGASRTTERGDDQRGP
ncbi:MAG: NAD-binding protein [Solirubrobacterales bacterium]|nr:NAD-binding protein [Solirubrobacterales bacterium]